MVIKHQMAVLGQDFLLEMLMAKFSRMINHRFGLIMEQILMLESLFQMLGKIKKYFSQRLAIRIYLAR